MTRKEKANWNKEESVSTQHWTRSVRPDEEHEPKPWSTHSPHNQKIFLTAFVHYSAADLWPTSAPRGSQTNSSVLQMTPEASLQHKQAELNVTQDNCVRNVISSEQKGNEASCSSGQEKAWSSLGWGLFFLFFFSSFLLLVGEKDTRHLCASPYRSHRQGFGTIHLTR